MDTPTPIPRISMNHGPTSDEVDQKNRLEPLMSPNRDPVQENKMIKLNVGGKRFCTSLSTLTKIPHTMLFAMFGGNFPLIKDEDTYFIDRDGTYFNYILNYLRDGDVILPLDPVVLKQILKEAEFYQIPGLKEVIMNTKPPYKEYVTVRYLPAATYDGWPIRLEGPMESSIVYELNGGIVPPEKDGPDVKNIYGNCMNGWKIRGIFLTKIFNQLALEGWILTEANGSGAGQNNFAEMYVFSRDVLNPPPIASTGFDSDSVSVQSAEFSLSFPPRRDNGIDDTTTVTYPHDFHPMG